LRKNPHVRIWAAALLLVLIPLGFLTKFYHGPLETWVNNSLGGVLYVIFWSLVVFFFFPAATPYKITGTVFIVTSMIEALQLWHPPFLEAVRSTRIGVTLIGNSFAWLDFPHYLLGSLLAYLLIYRLSEIKARKS
jgi:hypothetical protein